MFRASLLEYIVFSFIFNRNHKFTDFPPLLRLRTVVHTRCLTTANDDDGDDDVTADAQQSDAGVSAGGRRADGRRCRRPDGAVPKAQERRRPGVLPGQAQGRRRVLVVRRRPAAQAARVPLSVQRVGVVRGGGHRTAVGPRLFRSGRRQPGRLLQRRARSRARSARHVQSVPVQQRLLQRRRRYIVVGVGRGRRRRRRLDPVTGRLGLFIGSRRFQEHG